MRAHSITLTAMLAIAAPAARADNHVTGRISTKAIELAETGRALHSVGVYTAAVTAFKEAYALAPSPSLLYNIAQSYRLSGHCDEAASMYRRFLETRPSGDQRRLAKTHLSALDKCGTGGLRITVPPDGRALDPTLDATIDATIEATSRPTDETRSLRYKRIGVAITIGGGVTLATAAILALHARDGATTVAEPYKHGRKASDVADDVDGRGRPSSTITTVLAIGGGLAVGSGVVMYALGRHYERAGQVVVTPTAHGAQVTVSWGFQ